MARLRYSRAEAEAEATRRAEAFVAVRPDRERFRFRGAFPDTAVSPRRASKHPVVWVAMFQLIPENGDVIDGGELLVSVDLETGRVGYHGHPEHGPG
ncbi:unnamed protein product [Gemmataceae bacterium]|nr:unnamed protein product [Gemmataceae bacterium]VTU02344.1 unnamed protein product [Gemmataceae bacterium]